ncbi:hypothetical protein HMSSN036_09380 [Paenibacillus macerans]|nr:hypothetical protein HMSSN036_09380 [Paenibacillus macerans]
MKANAADAITILLDGTKLTTDAPPYIKAQQNVTMVPLRVISEGLGAQVAWSQAAKRSRSKRTAASWLLS